MRKSFSHRMSIIVIPGVVIGLIGAISAVLFDAREWLVILLSALAAWFLICAVIFARPDEKSAEEPSYSVCEAAKEETVVPEIITDHYEYRAEINREKIARECKSALDELDRLAGNGEIIKSALTKLKDAEHGLHILSEAESSLRKAISMCEDVTSEVYILSVLANVEVGAYSDSHSGFDVIAKQIQPLAEVGSMAAIEAKASADGAFGSVGGIMQSIKDSIKEAVDEEDKRKRMLVRIEEARHAVDKLSGETVRLNERGL